MLGTLTSSGVITSFDVVNGNVLSCNNGRYWEAIAVHTVQSLKYIQ